MGQIKLYKTANLSSTLIQLVGSKSESNRALLINALCKKPGSISNLALARDTQIMQDLLFAPVNIYNAQDAGTVMRFMAAYLSVTKQHVILKGSERMKKRPIGILVESLKSLGIEIDYLEEVGYPPLKISGLKEQISSVIEVESNVSSQYISALLMIAPILPAGLTINLKEEGVSKPYIDMTVSIMRHFGINVNITGQSYFIMTQQYVYNAFTVESDWSGASYWYAIFALSNLPELRLKGLKEISLQGDSVVANMMEGFGVKTIFKDNMAILKKQPLSLPKQLDFIKCPDLAQTFTILCAAIGHPCTFLGLHTLKIKETDRVLALKTELQKLGADFIEYHDRWKVVPIPRNRFSLIQEARINTYDDHRMAMAFAILATKMNVIFDDSEVVNKSYPSFWDDMEQVGFKIARGKHITVN